MQENASHTLSVYVSVWCSHIYTMSTFKPNHRAIRFGSHTIAIATEATATAAAAAATLYKRHMVKLLECSAVIF